MKLNNFTFNILILNNLTFNNFIADYCVVVENQKIEYLSLELFIMFLKTYQIKKLNT